MNIYWISAFKDVSIQRLPRTAYDHTPLLINISYLLLENITIISSNLNNISLIKLRPLK